jgi:hypothetical protein
MHERIQLLQGQPFRQTRVYLEWLQECRLKNKILFDQEITCPPALPLQIFALVFPHPG